MDNELFGELHEQEENGLYGKRHERELLNLSNNAVQSKQLNLESCSHSCGPSDFYKGGKCDRMGCYLPNEQLVCDICKMPYTKEEMKVGHCFNCGEQEL